MKGVYMVKNIVIFNYRLATVSCFDTVGKCLYLHNSLLQAQPGVEFHGLHR